MNTKSSFIYDDFRISQESMDRGWIMPYSHYHASHEIYILKSGERRVEIDDTDYRAKAYDATLFSGNTPHKSSGEVPFSGICIHFSDRYLDLHFTPMSKKYLMKCFNHKVIALSESDFEIIKSIADNFTVGAEDNFLKLSAILNILNTSYTPHDRVEKAAPERNVSKSRLIFDYVNNNYAYIKHIGQITELIGVSERYVFKIFRDKYNQTPKQYINRLRVQTACHRLKYTDKTVKSIAHDCGFDSYEYFISVFKKIIGVTPTEYRIHEKQDMN